MTTSYEVRSTAERSISLAALKKSRTGDLRNDSTVEDDRLKEAVGTSRQAELFYPEVAQGGYEASKRPFVWIEKEAASDAAPAAQPGAVAATPGAAGQDSRCRQLAAASTTCYEFHGNVTARVEIPLIVNGTRQHFALGATVEHATFQLASSMPNARIKLFRLWDSHPIEVRSDDPKALQALPLVDGDRIEVRESER